MNIDKIPEDLLLPMKDLARNYLDNTLEYGDVINSTYTTQYIDDLQLTAMLVLSECNSEEEMLRSYDGYSVETFLNEL